MVQATLGLRPVDYDIVDAVPQTQKIKKKIQVDNEWEDRMFIRIPVGPDRLGLSGLEKWCKEHYKEPRYLGPWFKVSGFIILDEKTYVHWKLCE
jgi:hypothetical protein